MVMSPSVAIEHLIRDLRKDLIEQKRLRVSIDALAGIVSDLRDEQVKFRHVAEEIRDAIHALRNTVATVLLEKEIQIETLRTAAGGG